MLLLISIELLQSTYSKLTVYSRSSSTTQASIHTCIANKYKLIRTIHQIVEIEVKKVLKLFYAMLRVYSIKGEGPFCKTRCAKG